MIKKELGVFRRVPGSSDQNTDLDITLTTGRIRHVILMTLNDMLIKSVSIQCILVALHGIQSI